MVVDEGADSRPEGAAAALLDDQQFEEALKGIAQEDLEVLSRAEGDLPGGEIDLEGDQLASLAPDERHPARALTPAELFLDDPEDALKGLGQRVGLVDDDSRVIPAMCPRLLLDPPLIVRDQGLRGVDYIGRGAVVDGEGVGLEGDPEMCLGVQDVLRVGAVPFEDGLVVVDYNGKCGAVPLDDRPDQVEVEGLMSWNLSTTTGSYRAAPERSFPSSVFWRSSRQANYFWFSRVMLALPMRCAILPLKFLMKEAVAML